MRTSLCFPQWPSLCPSPAPSSICMHGSHMTMTMRVRVKASVSSSKVNFTSSWWRELCTGQYRLLHSVHGHNGLDLWFIDRFCIAIFPALSSSLTALLPHECSAHTIQPCTSLQCYLKLHLNTFILSFSVCLIILVIPQSLKLTGIQVFACVYRQGTLFYSLSKVLGVRRAGSVCVDIIIVSVCVHKSLFSWTTWINNKSFLIL